MPEKPDELQLLSVDEVAAILGYCRETVYKLARANKLPSVRLSPRRIRFRRADIEKHVAAHVRGERHVTPGPDPAPFPFSTTI